MLPHAVGRRIEIGEHRHARHARAAAQQARHMLCDVRMPNVQRRRRGKCHAALQAVLLDDQPQTTDQQGRELFRFRRRCCLDVRVEHEAVRRQQHHAVSTGHFTIDGHRHRYGVQLPHVVATDGSQHVCGDTQRPVVGARARGVPLDQPQRTLACRSWFMTGGRLLGSAFAQT